MLTVLTARQGKTFAKTVARDGESWTVSPYDYVKYVDALSLDIADLDELADLLTALEGDPSRCIVRGRPIGAPEQHNIRRLAHDRNDAVATFEDQPSHIVMLDIDDLAAPADLTMAQRVARVLHALPAPFRDADCFLQWSSSAGLKDWATLKAHVWFWLSEPVTTEYLRERCRGEAWPVDHQVFKTVQPHYTAAPFFTNAPDPLAGQRSRFIQRKHRTVTLPAWLPPPPPQYVHPVPQGYRADDLAYQKRVNAWTAAVVESRCEAIVQATDGEQNATIYKGARKLGQLVAGGLLMQHEATQFLEHAASSGGHPRNRARSTILSGLRAGMRDPIYGPPDDAETKR